MDKKKKTIVAIVGVACAIMMAVMLKVFVFPTSSVQKRTNQLAIRTPRVDDQKINRKSKLEHYQNESLKDMEQNAVVQRLGAVAQSKEDSLFNEPEVIAGALEDQQAIGQDSLSIEYPANPVPNELEQLMALQQQLLEQSEEAQAAQSDAAELEELRKVLQEYQELSQNPNAIPTEQAAAAVGQLDPEQLAEIGTSVSEKLAQEVQKKFTNKSYFHGAGAAASQDNVLGLIPAETVDQEVLTNGSTLAMRTKKEVRLNAPPIIIPKGAIIYGQVSFGSNRLRIAINSYKEGDVLYKLNFSLFDFDGVEGIHLGNRTASKIPSKVTKDVYEYAYQKGTQASTFGNENTGVDIDEIKNIAILSGAKELGKEIFDKRRVLMPKKYHLWFNINEN